MTERSRSIMRRKLLKTGLAGGAMIAFLPLWKLFSISSPQFDSCIKPESDLSRESFESLRKASNKYGAEFGDIGVNKINDSLESNSN